MKHETTLFALMTLMVVAIIATSASAVTYKLETNATSGSSTNYGYIGWNFTTTATGTVSINAQGLTGLTATTYSFRECGNPIDKNNGSISNERISFTTTISAGCYELLGHSNGANYDGFFNNAVTSYVFAGNGISLYTTIGPNPGPDNRANGAYVTGWLGTWKTLNITVLVTDTGIPVVGTINLTSVAPTINLSNTFNVSQAKIRMPFTVYVTTTAQEAVGVRMCPLALNYSAMGFSGLCVNATGSDPVFSLTYPSGLVDENRNQTFFIATNGSTGNYTVLFDSTNQFTLFLNDTINPAITGYAVTPTSPALYSPANVYVFTATITDNIALLKASVWVNQTEYGMTHVGSLYTARINATLTTGTYTINISAQDTTGNTNNTAHASYTILNATIDNCAVNNLTALNVSTLLSTTALPINTTSLVTFTASYQLVALNVSYVFNFTNYKQWALCMNVNQTVNITGNIVYADYNGTYAQQTYSFSHATIKGGSPTLLDLYVTPGTSNIIITVQDYNHFPVSGYTVTAQTVLYGGSTYQTVASAVTGMNGQVVMNLVPNTNYYVFIVQDGSGTLVLQTSPTVITSSTIILQLNALSSVTLNEQKTSRATCTITYDNSTQQSSFVWNTNDGMPTTACLNVKRINPNNEYTLVDSCTLSSSGTITVPINNTEGVYGLTGSFTYADTPNTRFVCGSPVYLRFGDNGVPLTGFTGVVGLFISIIVFFVLVGVGLWNPFAAVVFGTLALVLTFLLGLWTVSITTFVGLLAVSGILLFRMKTGYS